MLLQKFSVNQMGIRIRFDFVILQETDGAIDFQHGERDVVAGGDPVFSHCPLQFVDADVLLGQVGSDDLAIMNQQAGLALDKFSEAAVAPGNFSHEIVHDQQRGRRDNASGQGCVRPGHRILHRIADQQQEGKVEGCHLPHFPLSAKANPCQDDDVNHRRANNNFQQHMDAGEHSAYSPAVTGTGALLGVLK
jgi:hypothetical protein